MEVAAASTLQQQFHSATNIPTASTGFSHGGWSSIPMPLSHLPLRPSSLGRFQQRGFTFTNELEDSKRRGGMNNLANELGVDISEAASLLREVESAVARIRGGSNSSQSDGRGSDAPTRTLRTAAELYSQYHHHGNKHNNRSIITVCRSLDRLLGDGLPRAEVTEVVGMPGVGKTQLAMQVAVTTRLLASYGGVEGQAVYLDTEGSFSPERCYAMAQALVSHVQATYERRRQQYSQSLLASQTSHHHHNQLSDRHNRSLQPPPVLPDWWTSEYILRGIHVYRIHDEAALMATFHALPHFFQEQEKQGHWPVRLVVVDSIAFPYRCAPVGLDYLARTRSLTTVATMLADLGQEHNLAVMVINHMTTQIANGQSRIVPALGESWAHAVTNRLLVSIPNKNDYSSAQAHDDDQDNFTTAARSIRKCTLVKSPHKPNGDAYFQVLDCGIRDVPTLGEKDPNSGGSDQRKSSHSASKRLRSQY